MSDYISREAVLTQLCNHHCATVPSECLFQITHTGDPGCFTVDDILKIPAADVRPVKEGENITENNPVDEFVCSKCGIIIEDWSRVEIDEDDGERTNHEYVFRFCPNCGAKVRGGQHG